MRISLAVLMFLGASACAGTNAGTQSARCASEAHRQMDFLVGAWDTAYARTPERPAGRDVYALSLDGCALMEHWTSPDGREIGMSVNAYDRSAGVWRYVFTDSVGAWTQMDGVWDGAVFRYEGEAADRSSGGLTRIRARMELAPMADGRVQQTYFTQSEAGDWAPRYQVVMTRRD